MLINAVLMILVGGMGTKQLAAASPGGRDKRALFRLTNLSTGEKRVVQRCVSLKGISGGIYASRFLVVLLFTTTCWFANKSDPKEDFYGKHGLPQ
jgi:hypothetical protein